MNKSNQVDAVLLEEPSIGQDPDFPHPPPGLASAFSKALARVVDRFRLLFGKLPPSIKSHPSIAWGAGIALVVVVGFGAWRLLRSGTTVPANPRPARIERLENLARDAYKRSEEHTSELQSPCNLVCRLLLEKKKKIRYKELECTDIA